jgi:hypothetical protein
MQGEEPKKRYPSKRIQEMQAEMAKLRADEESFNNRYRIMTTLESIEAIIIIVELFKTHLQFLKSGAIYREKLKELDALQKKLDIPMQEIATFYNILQGFYMVKEQFVFIVHAKDPEQFEMFDLLETNNTLRIITLKECGNTQCRKKASDGHALIQCKGCHLAAYCSQECYTKDWEAHHKFYCKEMSKELKAEAAAETKSNRSLPCEGQAYPSRGLKDMLKKYAAIRDSHKAFDEKYRYTSSLPSRGLIFTLTELFKKQDTVAYEAFIKKSSVMVSEEEMRVFDAFLRLQQEDERYVFMVFADKDPIGVCIDLLEKPEETRYVTTEECGNMACRKSEGKLRICLKCKKAAYCSKKCQNVDWNFHSEYCFSEKEMNK